jgi:hypothetical protein
MPHVTYHVLSIYKYEVTCTVDGKGNTIHINTYHLHRQQLTMLSGLSPFLFSPSRNVLTGIGWNVEARLTVSLRSTGGRVSCLSRLRDPSASESGSCTGLGCFEANVTAGLHSSSVTFVHTNNSLWSPNPCSYGMIVEKSWYNFSSEDLFGYGNFSRKHPRGVPFVIDFAIRNGSCPAKEGEENYACLSGNSSCVDATSGPGYLCRCWEHYDGNPFIPHGCQGRSYYYNMQKLVLLYVLICISICLPRAHALLSMCIHVCSFRH